jgi:hypothetical protein
MNWVFLHVIGAFAVVMSLASICWHVIVGGRRQFEGRRWMMLTHGIGLMAVLVSGLALAMKFTDGMPAFIYVKLLIWLMLGGIAFFIFRFPHRAKIWWWTVWGLASIAAYLGAAFLR